MAVRAFAQTVVAVIALAAPVSAIAGELSGPGRFCGYAPIIDLLEGERVMTLQGGIHGGTFEWQGSFGALEVNGIGWAGKPVGQIVNRPTRKGHAIFKQRKDAGKFVVAIWNRAHGAAYFTSPSGITKAQLDAIDRVDLFDEMMPDPTNCNLRTVFSWEQP